MSPETVSVELRELSTLGGCPGRPVSGTLNWCKNDGGALDSGVPPDCYSGSSNRLTGTLDGVPLDLAIGTGNGVLDSTVPIELVLLETSGLGLFFYSVSGGVHGILKLPDDANPAGLFICFGDGSDAAVDGPIHQFTLRSLSVLGSCPGTAVQGTASGCLG
jgi:hypothetical protein